MLVLQTITKMRSLLTIIIILSSALGFGQVAEFSFKQKTYKFPKAKEGEQLSHYYVFTNTGTAPLKINSYVVECHCTELRFPTYEIQPGKIDSVLVKFDTNGKYFAQDRNVIISSNARKKETILRFKVFVEPKE
jgi:hypothetical protein